MLQNLTIEEHRDELTYEIWDFYFLDGILYLDKYLLYKRESEIKKKYEILKCYDRLMRNNSNIEESEVPFTEEIKGKAFDKFISKIEVKKWSEK